MAVKGFNVGGAINRYDFNSLVNKEGAVTAEMLGSDVTTQLTTMSGNISTLQSQVATLNDGYTQLNNALDEGSKRPFFRRVNFSNSLTCKVDAVGNGVGLLIAGTSVSTSIWVMRYRPANSQIFMEKIGGALSTTFSGTCTTDGVVTITASESCTFAVWMT